MKKYCGYRMNLSYSILAVFMFFASSHASASVCTGMVTVKEMYPRDGGWIHVVAEGVSNMDLNNCGHGGSTGLLLNYNDTHGSLDGKKMIFSSLLAAFTAGKKLNICSDSCDSQHPTYSRLSYINNLMN